MRKNAIDTRDRLREAALKLFLDHGYEATTTAQIGELAHVTERTYFRYFKNKREVLFEDVTEVREVMIAAVDSTRHDSQPLELVMQAYLAAVPLLVAGRPAARRRAAVIATSSALQESACARTLALINALTAAVTARGFDESTAQLASQVGAAIFNQAMRAWNADSTADLTNLITRAAETAQRLLCDAPPPTAEIV